MQTNTALAIAPNNRIARIRTIRQCIAYLKSLDADNCISEWFLRQLCKQGLIKHFLSGSAVYVNLDNLLDYLNGGY